MMNQELQVTQQRRGSTLLLALIILSGLVATSLTVGTIVVTRLRGVKAIDDSVLASYAAESAVEDLLYAVRKGERCVVREALGVIREEGCISLNASGTLWNTAAWTRTVAPPSNLRSFELAEDRVEQLDLFPPTGDLVDTGVRALLVTALAPASDAWLEVTWVPWLRTGEWAPAGGRVLFGPSEIAGRVEKDVPLSVSGGGDPIGYRVRMRAISGDVGTLEVRARKSDGTRVDAFGSRITANIVGTMGSAQYATRVEFPSFSLLAPVFDYVLFSECDIVKGGTISCP